MKVRKDVVELPDGKTQYDYFLWEMPNVVAVVPITEDGQVVMIREYKHGVGEVMLKYSAGFIDAAEEPDVAAARELKEETGYEAQRWSTLLVVASDPAKSLGRTHLFLAEGAQKVAEQQLEATEQVEVVLLTPAETLQKIERGEIWETASIAATFLAGRKLGWVQAKI